MSRLILIFVVISACALPQAVRAAGPADSPELVVLDSRNTAFKQFSADVEQSRKLLYADTSPEAAVRAAEMLTIFRYKVKPGDDLFAVAARCNIPYSCIATINRFAHADEMIAGAEILLPTVPGIFVFDPPSNETEKLLTSDRLTGGLGTGLPVTLPASRQGRLKCAFYPGADFLPTERFFFLNKGFSFPLRVFKITSPYGPRVNPVSGVYGLHKGVDLAAPEGSPVYASREGTVSETGEDPVYGKYIIISHSGGRMSLYGHLSKIETTLRDVVQSGTLIGRVGSTGQSTGPHLHFELRQNGRSLDPGALLGVFKEQ